MYGRIGLILAAFCMPFIALAHEVYVLTPDEITRDLNAPELNIFSIALTHESRFLFWTALAIGIVIFVFLLSISKVIEQTVRDPLASIKRYAPFIGRVTLGLSLISSAYFDALFGPELPLSTLASADWGIVLFRLTLALAGCAVLVGFWTRRAALLGIIVFCIGVGVHGLYMLTYFSYLGELVFALILGGGEFSFDRARLVGFWKTLPIAEHVAPMSFFILRILFGISLIYSSAYAKFIHGQLAIDTVIKHHLTLYFPFDPPFIVLGAFIIEILIGLFFIIGFEVRFTALFMLVFLTLSIIYFGEAVWPHIILLGTAIAIFVHGYDRYTLEERFLIGKNHTEEPIF